jgi:hypothetical protein
MPTTDRALIALSEDRRLMAVLEPEEHRTFSGRRVWWIYQRSADDWCKKAHTNVKGLVVCVPYWEWTDHETVDDPRMDAHVALQMYQAEMAGVDMGGK